MLRNNTNWIKAYIVDVLPCISVAFFVLAFIYLSSFYSVFGIDITNYSSFGDIILRISSPLINFAILFFIYFIFIREIIKMDIEDCEYSTSERLSTKAAYIWLRLLFDMQHYRYFVLIYVLIYNLICYVCVYLITKTGLFTPTLNLSCFSLLFPFIIIFIIISFRHNRLPFNYIKKLIVILKNNLGIIIPIYFIYAISVFSYIGYEYAEITKEEGIVKFEIRTTNGTVFTDKDYIYVDRMCENVFLYKKNTEEAIILKEEGLEFTKMIDKRLKINSVIVESIYFAFSNLIKLIKGI